MASLKTAALVFMIVAVTVVVVVGPTPAAQETDSSAEFSIPEEVKDLLLQRLEILRQIESNIRKMLEAGRASLEELLDATRDRLAGELELAESRDARLEILLQQVETARALEKHWRSREDVGRAHPHDVLRIRLSRLAAEIDLAREKSGSSTEKAK